MNLDNALRNVGEYYSAHYLAEQFPKDIADPLKTWKEQGSQSPPRRLQGLGDAYFKAKARALDYPDPMLRSRAKMPELQAWHPLLLAALGYQPEPLTIALPSEQRGLPALLRLHRHNRPWLVVLQTPFCVSGGDLAEEPLELSPDQHPAEAAATHTTPTSPDAWPILPGDWEHAIATLFQQEDHPRWALLLAGSRIYLFDAHSYAQGRYLIADLEDAYARRRPKTFEAIAALLARDTLAPKSDSEQLLHERLREGSLKSTHGVSSKLQAAVREAIQAIANGWVDARRRHKLGYRRLGDAEDPLPDGGREITAEQLRHEALVTVYRILFCLYAEARGGELGILPISDDVYRLGYSLEALRDLADRGEPGTSSENGSYYAEHLQRLFRLIHAGFHPEANTDPGTHLASDTDSDHHGSWTNLPQQGDLFGDSPRQLSLDDASPSASRSPSSTGARKRLDTGLARSFQIQPLTANLFDPSATPLLNRVQLGNCVLHQVIRCLSLGTGPGSSGRGRQIGRINYAELGIVQLGSVYEDLLSYRGFFAHQDLIQVLAIPKGSAKKQSGKLELVYDDAIDPQTPTWFVPADRLDQFRPGEIVIERRSGKPRLYKLGEFILHLNGVDRVNSASYYTPEVLTRALVRETLNERLKDFGPDEADHILNLTICEPAMGSAAFLVEALSQLADRYLGLKQQQLGRNIDPGDYDDQRRRVMHYIAVHQLYGVDLNPTAVELGTLSLWLASIHRLPSATSEEDTLDGAQLYRPGATPWFGLRLRAGNSLIGARRAVWTEHQLITGAFYGKNAQAPRQLTPGEARTEGEVYHFLVWDQDMAPAARDKLMRQHWPEQCATINAWQQAELKRPWTPEQIAAARRLSQRIDSLWQDYAHERAAGLRATRCTASVWPQPIDLRPGPSLARQEQICARLESESGAFQRLKGLMDAWCALYFWPLDQAADLPSRDQWLSSAQQWLDAEDDAPVPPWYLHARAIAERQPFHHWELVFTEVLGPGFKEQQRPPAGFDLMFGNPPWIKVSWKDDTLLAEFEPLLGVRGAKSASYNRERPKLLGPEQRRLDYRAAFEQAAGTGQFLNDPTLYPALAGVQTNLYKNFIERSWGLLAEQGVAGLLHPEGVFDDPRGGVFREEYCCRLIAHYQFSNQLMWFPDVGHRNPFSINISGRKKPSPLFQCVFNLFHSTTLEQSLNHKDTHDPVPGIKNPEGHWELRGHQLRILTISTHELGLFAQLFEDADTPALQARLPQVHSQPLLKVLEKFASAPRRLGDLQGQYLATVMFDETYAQRDGIITREGDPAYQPKSADDWVVSGPHFFVGTPLNKTPRQKCTEKAHYDAIDLTTIPDNYLPRAVYRPGDADGDLSAFHAAIPEWPKPGPRRPPPSAGKTAGISEVEQPTQPRSKGTGAEGMFWPIADHEVPAWDALLGQPLRRHGIAPTSPGAHTARQFGWFDQWQGPVQEAITWLATHQNQRDATEFATRFGAVRLQQREPSEEEMRWLPRPLTSFFRHVNRRRGQPANERTLIPTFYPPGFVHIHPVLSITFLHPSDALLFNGCSSTILWDFLVKIGGRGDIYESTVATFPLATSNETQIVARILRLTSLTTHYTPLWQSTYTPTFKHDDWTSTDPRLTHHHELPWGQLTPDWQRGCALRSDYARRQALLKIDVLVALSLDLSLDELIQIYSVQFPVMKAYEQADRYDAHGRRLPTTTRKDPGAKELREALKTHPDGTTPNTPLTITWPIDNGQQTVSRSFHPPLHPGRPHRRLPRGLSGISVPTAMIIQKEWTGLTGFSRIYRIRGAPQRVWSLRLLQKTPVHPEKSC